MTSIEAIENIVYKILFLLIVIALLIISGNLIHNLMIQRNIKDNIF